MLIGEYSPSLDSKGRVNFPSKLREELGERFIITKGLDNCLFVYSLGEWKVLENKIRELPMSKSKGIQRFFFAGATEVEADKQGRIIIPANLRKHANLEKDITIVGVSVRAEIWATDAYLRSSEELTSDMIADVMDELGF